MVGLEPHPAAHSGWLVYGMALPDWPLIWSSAITVAFMLVIVALKVRYG